jgi:hypothetical protein
MNDVFADTFYFLGLLNGADESHGRCAAFAKEFRGVLCGDVSRCLADALRGVFPPNEKPPWLSI